MKTLHNATLSRHLCSLNKPPPLLVSLLSAIRILNTEVLRILLCTKYYKRSLYVLSNYSVCMFARVSAQMLTTLYSYCVLAEECLPSSDPCSAMPLDQPEQRGSTGQQRRLQVLRTSYFSTYVSTYKNLFRLG